MKKPRPLWRVSILTSPEAEEAVAELLAGIVQQPVSVYLPVEKRDALVTVYLNERREFSHAKRRLVEEGLRTIARVGLSVGPGRISVRRVRREDWAESWKRHFKPLEIGPSLLVKPSWSKRRPKRNQVVVILDPGLSFGTGQHPTTRFCLRQLAAFRDGKRAQSFLDIGTGSGILAVSAVKLGYTPVDGIDFDPQAVLVARSNAARNGVLARAGFVCRDLLRLPLRPARKYDVVCANLIYDLLLAGKERILGRLQPGGLLVLSGILRSQFPAVQRVYRGNKLRMLEKEAENEWESGAFVLEN